MVVKNESKRNRLTLSDCVLAIGRAASAPFELETGVGRQRFSCIYLYSVVSIGLVLAVTVFVGKETSRSTATLYFDVFCIACVLTSVVWMGVYILPPSPCGYTDNRVVVTMVPKRYYRPFLIVVYLFGTATVVTDSIAISMSAVCVTRYPWKLVLHCLKAIMALELMAFVRKFCCAIFNDTLSVSWAFFHCLATQVCLIFRIPLTDSTPLWSRGHNVSTCHGLFGNPLVVDKVQHVITFEAEFYVTALVLFLSFWSNMRGIETSAQTQMGTGLRYQSLDEHSHPSRSPHVPNADFGLIIGLVFGAVLSMPYTFGWQDGLLADKKTELFTFHSLFIVSMLAATLIALFKFRRSRYCGVQGVAFQVSVLLLLLLVACLWHFSFVMLASVVKLIHTSGQRLIVLATVDAGTTFLQVLLQTTLIVKAYSYTTLNQDPGKTNTIKQCLLFLMVSNFMLWIHTIYFYLNLKDQHLLQMNFYGRRLWQIMDRTMNPFCMYFRLFSAILLFELCSIF